MYFSHFASDLKMPPGLSVSQSHGELELGIGLSFVLLVFIPVLHI